MRKIWHIVGVGFLTYIYLNLGYHKLIYVGASLVIGTILLDYTRLQFEPLNLIVQKVMRPFIREEEKHQLSALSFLVIGVYITALLFPKEIVFLTYAFLALGDPSASFFGILYGKTKVGAKSLEGTLSCFIVCTLLALVYFSYNNFFDHRIFIAVPLAGLIGASCELIQIKPLDDNMTFPLLSGFGLWGLFYILGI